MPVARQAGSEDPVRRSMVDSERKTAANLLRAIGGTLGNDGVRKDPPSKGIPGNPSVGDCFGSLGPAAGKRQLIQAKQNPHKVGVT